MSTIEREKISRLRRELAQLKAPPTLTIIRANHDDPQGYMMRLRFEWRGYRHDTLVDRNLYEDDPKYQSYLLRAGVEATIRAFAEVELLPRMITLTGGDV